MFSSSGFFKGITCPYLASGLCERPYCHYRHAGLIKFEDKKQGMPDYTPTPSESLGQMNLSNRQTPSMLNMVGSAINKVQTREKYDETGKLILYRPTLKAAGKSSVVAAMAPVNRTRSHPGFPDYTPTPIHILRQNRNKVDDLEYDPISNYSTKMQPLSLVRVTLADAEREGAKRSRETEEDDKNTSKKMKSTTIEKNEKAKFSDNESNDKTETINDVEKLSNENVAQSTARYSPMQNITISQNSDTLSNLEASKNVGDVDDRTLGLQEADVGVIVDEEEAGSLTNCFKKPVLPVKSDKMNVSKHSNKTTKEEKVIECHNDKRHIHHTHKTETKRKSLNLTSNKKCDSSRKVNDSDELNKSHSSSSSSSSSSAVKKDRKNHHHSRHPHHHHSNHQKDDGTNKLQKDDETNNFKKDDGTNKSKKDDGANKLRTDDGMNKLKKDDGTNKLKTDEKLFHNGDVLKLEIKALKVTNDTSNNHKHNKSDKSESKSRRMPGEQHDASDGKIQISEKKVEEKIKANYNVGRVVDDEKKLLERSVSDCGKMKEEEREMKHRRNSHVEITEKQSKLEKSSKDDHCSSSLKHSSKILAENLSKISSKYFLENSSKNVSEISSKHSSEKKISKHSSKSSSSHHKTESKIAKSLDEKKSLIDTKHKTSTTNKTESQIAKVVTPIKRVISQIDLFGEDSDTEFDASFNLVTEKIQERKHSSSSLRSFSKDDDDDDGDNEDDNDNGMISSSSGMLDDVILLSEYEDSDAAGNKRFEECHRLYMEANKKKNKIKNSELGPAPQIQSIFNFEESSVVCRKRVAHAPQNDMEVKRVAVPSRLHQPSAAKTMMNRYIELQKASKDSNLSTSTDNTSKKVSFSSANSHHKRIAPTTIVSTRADLKEINSKGGNTFTGISTKGSAPNGASSSEGIHSKGLTSKAPDLTGSAATGIASTVTMKNKERVAHVPKITDFLKKPFICVDSNSKIPVNVRQKCLDKFFEECCNIYDTGQDASDRAESEEKAIHEKSANKSIYLNLASNVVRRLREECRHPQNKNLSQQQQPKNPKALSHEFVLGGPKATSANYTINRCGKPIPVPDTFSGLDLYKRLQRYVLTEEELLENSFPRHDNKTPDIISIKMSERDKDKQQSNNPNQKFCCRCGKPFIILPSGSFARQEDCIYHWGHAWKQRVGGTFDNIYNCCGSDTSSRGCQMSKYHVHDSNKYQCLKGYQSTICSSPPLDGNYGVYAIDCEMVYTTLGSELARVTVIDSDLKPVLDRLVKPDHHVLDYNSRFSGLTADNLKNVMTSLRDVQAILLNMLNDRTILIGHSLESDLVALKMVHSTVVDTSLVFPHRKGLPFKRALQNVVKETLQKIIQNDVSGHDSTEDARSCMELMLWKVKEDAKRELRYA